MIHKGVATFGLDWGECPKWLFSRMAGLGREVIRVMVEEYGPDEFIERIADPVWFQSLGTVLAFDWNASGLTTTLTAALKEAIRGQEKSLGIFICGGKGKTSRKTPEQISSWGEKLSLPAPYVSNLVYNSKMAAKIDSALVQDGFQLYHHTFFFSRSGAWAVVQQGMNTGIGAARRYHWHSKNITDLVCEPHSGIASQAKANTLDLTAKESQKNQKISTELVNGNYSSLMKDIEIIRKHFSSLSRTITARSGEEQATFLHLENKEFHWHPVMLEDFSKSRYLERMFWQVCQTKPENYEKLVAMRGVGPKTVRALSLVAEVIYGAKPSYEDPARYSFAFGGKDGTPYPVDRITYDKTIDILRKVVSKARVSFVDKRKMLSRLDQYSSLKSPVERTIF